MVKAYSNIGIKSSWLLPLRLITFVFILGIIAGWMGMPSYLEVPFLVYSIVTLAAFVLVLFIKRINYYILLRTLIATHFISEIINEAGIVYSTGTLYSPFSALFILTIVSSALIYRLVGTLVVASVVSLAYTIVTWYNGLLIPPDGGIMELLRQNASDGNDAIFYSTFLHILIFYTVAFISGYLAQNLQSTGAELNTASRELKEVRLDTGDILRNLTCGVLTIDRNGEIVYFNRAAELILGLSETEASGKHYREVLTDELGELAEQLGIARKEDRLSRTELEISRDGAEPIPLGLSTSTMYDENMEKRGVVAIFQDLTEAKKLEEKIRQADRMAAVGELSAYIAHEIRNPLASISGSVELLQNDLVLDGDNERLMGLILKESSRLNKILSDFLLYARVSRPQFNKVELNHLVSDIVELIRRHPAYNKNIELESISGNRVTYISGDEDHLKQMLLNLAVNACEALGTDGGKLSFEILPDLDILPDAMICLRVIDDGPGISKEDISRVFLPFFSTKRGGTGLGLAIVARLMETLQGRIDVSSEPGCGTTFHLYFKPFASGKTPQSPARPRTIAAAD